VSAPEFSRTVRIDTLGAAPRTIEIAADEGERAALARRFGFVSIDRLEASAAVSLGGEVVSTKGRLRASVVQSCVASGDPVAETVEAPFAIEFRPHPKIDAAEEEIELHGAELDVVFFDGGLVDLGEAVAETLSLSVEAYPRAPGAEDRLREAGVKSEEDAGALGPLAAALRDKIKP
jgi:uncharacterized metal-binding protein YceD (DUF177 family)